MHPGYRIFSLAKLPLVAAFVYSIIILLYAWFYPNVASSYSLGISNQKLETIGNNISLLNKDSNKNLEILLISNLSSNDVVEELNNLAKRDNNDVIIKTLKDFAVPIAAAIVGATAALWNMFQARWNGRHFQQLILRELRELEPTSNEGKPDGKLESYVNTSFIHKDILHHPTENRDFVSAFWISEGPWSRFVWLRRL